MQAWFQILGLALLIPLSWAQDQQTVEPTSFNATEALLEQGIDLSLLEQANLNLTARGESAHPTCPLMCKTLALTFNAQTYQQGSSQYESFRASYWSVQQASVEPQCVFEPTSAQQLSVAILLSRLTQCQWAAKSGGHAAFASASSIEDGVSISLAKFNQINIAKDKQTVDVGTGNKWQAVYEKVEQSGLVVLGGRDGDIGVGGLTTGGGISLFSGQYGWVCDNVVSFTVVTAWGLIVEASATSNPDLYWALRGGGNNFGLVTNFKFRAFPMGKIWGGAVGWLPDAFPALIKAFYNLGKNSETDPKAATILSFSATGSALGNIAQTLLSYSLPQVVPPILAEFAAVPNAIYNTTSIRSISNYSEGFATWPAGSRDEIWTHTSVMNVDFMTWLQETFFDIGGRVQSETSGVRPSLSFQSITKAGIQKMSQNSRNPLGLIDDLASAPLLMMSQAWIWTDAQYDATVIGAMREFQQKTEAKAVEMGIHVDYRYMNYANEYQDVIASYGQDNKRKLKEIAAKYDPTAVFQRLQPGYFKLDGAPIDTGSYFDATS
ncbi:hypothetical protein LTR70_007316 [Exophiala xenobiotica]|uniref:FAD-binding PCMH-type domain-containing protein n=1 Tax=Lithohypha guttulata TaxID=1690604 RepID=A0ABR0K5U9_9EURO|nr:hypothetical protein LTR24_007086 [Lithohypha guttulata]KAK5314105.1 hypothetical protein LTR70_007316 [Exophiala xenobiotica]